MELQNVIRTVPVYKDSIKRGEVRILVNTNQTSAAKKPFRSQAVITSSTTLPTASSSSPGPSATITLATLSEKDPDARTRPSVHGTSIQCKRSYPPLLASLAATSSCSSPSPPKQTPAGTGSTVTLAYSGNSSHTIPSSSMSTHEVSNNTFYAGSSAVQTLASLTARSSGPTANSGRKQNTHDNDGSEMTPNSKAKHRYETSLGQLTKKFICLLRESPEGVSFWFSSFPND